MQLFYAIISQTYKNVKENGYLLYTEANVSDLNIKAPRINLSKSE